MKWRIPLDVRQQGTNTFGYLQDNLFKIKRSGQEYESSLTVGEMVDRCDRCNFSLDINTLEVWLGWESAKKVPEFFHICDEYNLWNYIYRPEGMCYLLHEEIYR